MLFYFGGTLQNLNNFKLQKRAITLISNIQAPQGATHTSKN
jgi:hypothetical protein